jgi:hypothetical protein
MAAPVVHSLGTITLNNGSVTVLGQSTAFDPAVEPGDILLVDNGNAVYEGYIDTVISATELTLVYPWRGPSFLNIGFKVVRGPYHGDPVKAGPKLAENLTLTRTVSEGAATAQQVATQKAAEAAASAATALEAEEDAAFHSSQAGTSAQAANDAQFNASRWAEGAGDITGQGNFSAKTHAQRAAASEQTAITKAGEATSAAGTATTKAQVATDKAQVATDQAGTATAKASEASTSAQTATTKAGEASTSAQTATTKAGEAAASAQAAATSEGNALTYRDQAYSEKVAATNAKNAAEAALDSFEDRYLLGKPVDPTTDNDGNPLLVGALYWNTSLNTMRVHKGDGVWGDASANVAILRWRKSVVPAGTTVLSGADDTGQTLAYTAGLEQVFINGVLLTDADYVRTNSGTITLAAATTSESTAYILAPTPFTSSDVFTKPESDARFAKADLSNATGPRGKEVPYAAVGQSPNDFKEGGRRIFEPNSPGLPTTGEWYVVETWVDLNAYWWVQVAEGFVTGGENDSKKYKRKGNTTDGWGGWVRVRETQAELDGRFAKIDLSNATDGRGQYAWDVPAGTNFDWLTQTGLYITPPGLPGAPEATANYLVRVQAGSAGENLVQYARQILHNSSADSRMWRRFKILGGWGAWHRIRESEEELDARYQAKLAYTPVQQGTGIGQTANVIKIGWSAGAMLKATVDNADLGRIWTDINAAHVGDMNGYYKFPSGLIVQWGLVGGGDSLITFPVAFPNAVHAVVATPVGTLAGDQSVNVTIDLIANHQFWTRPRYANSGGFVGVAAQNSRWLAIGY